MTSCELCGKPATGRALIEGVDVWTCAACATFGKAIPVSRSVGAGTIGGRKNTGGARPTLKPALPPAPILVIVSDYAKRIRDARTKTGLTQKEFALKINTKDSVLHHWETGTTEPTLDEARKLEKNLHVTLIEETTPAAVTSETKKASAGLTIGDVLKIK